MSASINAASFTTPFAQLSRRHFLIASAWTALPSWASAQPSVIAEPPTAAPDTEVPYVQTPPILVRRMLQMAEVSRKDLLWDLGSGDGRIVIAAAKEFGARAVGFEIDPALIRESKRLARRARVAERTQFVERDLFTLNFAQPSVVTLYLLPEFNMKLRPLLLAQMRPGSKVVSHEWDMGDWRADETLTFPSTQKPHGTKKEHVVMLWVIPANVAGHWQLRFQSGGATPPAQLLIAQRFQQTTATLDQGEVLWSNLRGTQLSMAIKSNGSSLLLSGEVNAARWRGKIERLGQWGNSTGHVVGEFSAQRTAG
ncbi:MAG: class I SAM-dependent methyltransferase [Betaproteobacteria bacterium]|nr:MAG: class I SAM-dependent methyltransferase [Betaproteobacteria bacterium]